jgi:hypothetical protein
MVFSGWYINLLSVGHLILIMITLGYFSRKRFKSKKYKTYSFLKKIHITLLHRRFYSLEVVSKMISLIAKQIEIFFLKN